MMEAYNEHESNRQELHMRMLAQLASWVTAPHVKRPIDPEKLLGKKKRKHRDPIDREEGRAMVNELAARMGLKG